MSIRILEKKRKIKLFQIKKKYHVYWYYQQYHQLNVNRLKDLQDEMYLVQQ
jgi:hypothetical protein